jgi:hypothetical protein
MPRRDWFSLESEPAEKLLYELAEKSIDPSALVDMKSKKAVADATNSSIDAALKALSAQKDVMGEEAYNTAKGRIEKLRKKDPKPNIGKVEIIRWLIQLAAKTDKRLAAVVKALGEKSVAPAKVEAPVA